MLIYSCLCASPSTLTSFMEERSEEERERTREERKEPGGPSLEREGMGGCLDARGVVRWLALL